MSSAFNEFWLMNAVSFVHQTLGFTLYVAGLVFALRRWRTGGRSTRLAAAGFTFGLLADVLTVASIFGSEWLTSGWTFYTPYSETNIWPMLALSAGLSLISLASTILILLALWTAWREKDRTEFRGAFTPAPPPPP